MQDSTYYHLKLRKHNQNDNEATLLTSENGMNLKRIKNGKY